MVGTQFLAEVHNILDLIPVVAGDHCAGGHAQPSGNCTADIGAGLYERSGHAGEGIVRGSSCAVQRDEQATTLGHSFEEGDQASRVTPAGVGEESKGDVEFTECSDDGLEFRVQGGFTAGEFETVDVRPERGEDSSPLGGQKRLRLAVEDVATTQAAVVAGSGEFEGVENGGGEDKRGQCSPTTW